MHNWDRERSSLAGSCECNLSGFQSIGNKPFSSHRSPPQASRARARTTKEVATSAREIDGSLETFPRWVSLLDALVESSNPRPRKPPTNPGDHHVTYELSSMKQLWVLKVLRTEYVSSMICQWTGKTCCPGKRKTGTNTE